MAKQTSSGDARSGGARQASAVEAGQAYFEMHHQAHRLVDQAMATSGLSLARAKVLWRLADNGAMNQATLAGLLSFAPRSVTETVDALEREGLLNRTVDPNDRRARILELTPAGRAAHEAAVLVREKVMDEIFGSLTPSERATFVALLQTIRTNLCSSGEIDCDQ